MYRITLSNLQESTAQQVFDRICAHLFTQMMHSKTSNGQCKYRQNTDKLSCAVGCLISDDEYQPYWEGKGWDDVVQDYGVVARHLYLLINMQYLHDSWPPNQWYSGMISIAKRYGLEFRHGR